MHVKNQLVETISILDVELNTHIKIFTQIRWKYADTQNRSIYFYT